MIHASMWNLKLLICEGRHDKESLENKKAEDYAIFGLDCDMTCDYIVPVLVSFIFPN